MSVIEIYALIPTDSLIHNWDQADIDLIDIDASAARYAEQVLALLREWYPDTSIDIEWTHNSLDRTRTTISASSIQDEEEAEAVVANAEEKIYNDMEWIVYA